MTISASMSPEPQYPKYRSTDIENQVIVTHHIEIHESISNRDPKSLKFHIEPALCTTMQHTLCLTR